MKKTVPISADTINEKSVVTIIDCLKNMGADEVFIYCGNIGKFQPYADIIKKYRPIFEKEGISVAIWISDLGAIHSEKYQYIISTDGYVGVAACPLCESFAEDFCNAVKEIARTGIKKIVMDDDFRMQLLGWGPCCMCETHLKLYGEMVGEQVTPEIMLENITSGPMNKYRKAWLDANKTVLEDFARKIRAAVDEVDKDIDIMLCYGPALFGCDGSDPAEISRILSSKEKPYARLSGAPFWVNSGFVKNLMTTVDFSRRQALHLKKKGFVCYAEDDSYPRPRHHIPVSHMELFHTAMLADGNCERILKYVIDYVSSPEYEMNYVKADIKNAQIYKDTKRFFDGKTPVGINVVEPYDRVYYAHKVSATPEISVMNSPSTIFLNECSFPAVFEPGDVNLIFGENARRFDREILKNGTILDIEAALILSENGIDVGILGQGKKDYEIKVKANCNPGYYEYYKLEDQKVALYGAVGATELTLSDNAEINSTIYNRGNEFVGSYYYENAVGEKFFVYNFDAEKAVRVRGAVKSYCRERQIAQAYERLSGKKYPALCQGNPGLYMMCKKDEASMAVGLWNVFADAIDEPVVELDREYKGIECINCTGRIEGDKVFLSTIQPFSYAAFRVTK